jgi:indolepyruvate ferredoxin oxidoreductase
MRLYALLAKLKFLRGTPFDPFGRSAHRRKERALIVHYEGLIEEVLRHLDAETYDLAVEIASYPELIRGYDSVKDEHLGRARARLEELRQRLLDPAAAPRALETA